jgi:hypothetical protein
MSIQWHDLYLEVRLKYKKYTSAMYIYNSYNLIIVPENPGNSISGEGNCT